MSTRATYSFSIPDCGDKHPVCFYVPHDGYPQEAATLFLALHHCANKTGGFAARFFRANYFAEFTSGHEAHSDTEYRYTLEKDGMLSVHQAIFYKKKKWSLLYKDSWYDFVNEFLALSGEDKLYQFKISADFDIYEVMSSKEALATIDQQTRLMNHAKLQSLPDSAEFYCQTSELLAGQVEERIRNIKPQTYKKSVDLCLSSW